jgi:capsular exopolysaccharide synthesis family protein
MASLLTLNETGAPPQVILVTSSAPGEGKTTVVCNLGAALATINRRVLLVDADFRRPTLHRVFDRPNAWGLISLLKERTLVDSYPDQSLARETEVPGLYLLTAGPGSEDAHHLLYSERLLQLLHRLRQQFGVVLIDSPPMLQIADARVLGRLADGVVLVVRAGKTDKNSAQAAAQFFMEDGIAVLGTVLNDWKPESSGYGFYKADYSEYYRQQR